MVLTTPNAKVSDGSQPPLTFGLSLSQPAGSRSLHRLVRPSNCALGAESAQAVRARRMLKPAVEARHRPHPECPSRLAATVHSEVIRAPTLRRPGEGQSILPIRQSK